ncbi:hypothetical protein [Terracidiphilus sp.]|uniref:hypothetical protein n=1 Tax=Terracidiphilus sp. TaxID=1964191 RepID=UPI003C1F5B3B
MAAAPVPAGIRLPDADPGLSSGAGAGLRSAVVMMVAMVAMVVCGKCRCGNCGKHQDE